MPQLSQRLGLDLADTFASDGKMLADLFKRVLGTGVAQPKTHFDDLFLTRRERRENFVGDLAQVREGDRFGRIQYRLILDKISEMRVFFFADRRFERDRLLCDLQHLSHFRNRNVHPLCDLFARRFAAEFLHQQTRGADELVDRLDHVDRDSNRAGLVGDGTRDSLADPPCGVCRELIASTPFELVDRFHQTDVAFLDQVKELQAAVRVLLRDRYHKTEIGLNQLALGLVRLKFADADYLIGAL